jgi:hypothetical protein
MPFDKISRGIFVGSEDAKMGYGHKKKEQRLAPTFVNLKSNTMKNTLQRYGLL